MVHNIVRRFLSAFLAALLIFTLIPAQAFAQDDTFEHDIIQNESDIVKDYSDDKGISDDLVPLRDDSSNLDNDNNISHEVDDETEFQYNNAGYNAYVDDAPSIEVESTVEVTGVKIKDKKDLQLSVNSSAVALQATVEPEDATDQTITWESSDLSVVTVEDGVVTPVGIGTATVTAKAGSFSDECSVSVNQETVAVTGVSLNAEELNLTVGGDPVTLVATVEPENAADKTVTWTSSDPAVATVADGIVTPVAMGTTTITATTADGSFTEDCKVTVWGSCGSEAKWFCDGTTLTIEGSGSIDDSAAMKQPWKSYLRKITKVVLGSQITSIGEFSFAGCNVLTIVEIPEDSKLESISKSAFKMTNKLTSVTLPGGLVSISDTNIANKEIHFRGTEAQWEALGYTGKKDVYVLDANGEEALYNPNPYDGKCGANATWHYDTATGTLTISGTGAIADYGIAAPAPWSKLRADIQTVVVEDGITAIGNSAFAACTKLQTITLADSVTSIGESAFNGSDVFTEISLEKVTAVGKSAFSGCAGLKEVSLPNVVSIGEQAFANCTELNSISLGSDDVEVESIGIRAFQNCSSLETAIFKNVKSIPQWAFQGTALIKVSFANVTEIGAQSFTNVTTLEEVSFGARTTTIGSRAFSGTGIKAVAIPGNVVSLEGSVFANCAALKEAEIAEGIREIPESLFYGDSSLESVALPTTLEKIGDYAFYNCTALTMVNYAGSDAQWAQITIGTNNDPLLNAKGLVAVTGVSLNAEELNLTVGEDPVTLVATVEPENAADKTVTWTSSDPAVATVADGIVTPVTMGTTTITVEAGGHSAKCTVYVKGAQVAVSGITLDKQELNLTVGEVSDPLVATVLPQDAMDKTVTWQSSDTKVATVDDNGAVTAVSAGSAVITAVTKDGNFSAACSVTVELNEDAIDLTTFSFTLKSSTRDGTMFEFPDLQIERVTEDTYRLNVPVYAVYDEATGRTVSIEMSAPDDWDKDFTVTYTAWASAVDGGYCLGQQTAESKDGKAVVSQYYNDTAWYGTPELEYSDFIVKTVDNGHEYKITMSLYNDLSLLAVKPMIGESVGTPLTVSRDSTYAYSATLTRGTRYQILAYGGTGRSSAITKSKAYICEAGNEQASGEDTKYYYTPGDENQKDFAIKITNDDSSLNIAERVYSLHFDIQDVPENVPSFKKYIVTLNGETIELKKGEKLPSITQYDDLSIRVVFDNVDESAEYAWVKGATPSTQTPVGDNSDTLTVDTSSTAGMSYVFACTVKCNGQSVKSSLFMVRKVNALQFAPPVITAQPESATYPLGKTASSLKIEATSSQGGSLRYQWYKNNTNSNEGGELIEGATASTYLPETSEVGTTWYYCEAWAYKGDIVGEKATSGCAEITVTESILPFAGSGTVSDPFIISSEADLDVIRKEVADGNPFAGMYFQFGTDIILSNEWQPIGTTKDGSGDARNGTNMLPFAGILDGANHIVTVADGGKPLFNYVRNATVKNLKIQGTNIDGYGLVNCYTVDYGDDGDYWGTGVPETISIENCHILSGTNIKYSGFLGGYASGLNIVRFSNCTVAQNVTIGYGMADMMPDGLTHSTGALAGDFNGYVTNCSSAATVMGQDKVGGLIGAKGQSMGPCEIVDSQFTGTVVSNGCAGGVVGSGYSSGNSPCVTIEKCTVSGEITGKTSVGGILGKEGEIVQCWDNGIGGIRNNQFTGVIHASGKNVGGIIGYMCSINRYNRIENNYYTPNCGADCGIGFVKYVDTDCATHETESGAVYFDTSKELPGISGVDKKNLNRSDDPLGADKDKLCYSEKQTEAYVESIAVSGKYKTEYLTGEKFDTAGIIVTATWSNGDTTTPAISEVTFTGFDSTEPGTITITAQYKNSSTTFVLTINPRSNKITVSVSIYGDSKHGASGGVHGLAMGGLSLWASEHNMEADTSETVWDVLKRVFSKYSMSVDASDNNQYNTIYIASVNGLGEFDNGKLSGWMYTVNGSHPDVGVSARYLKQGDEIILHYTDDYTKEEGGMTPVEKPGTAQKVIDLINKIGTVTYTDACKQRIDAARSAYDALTDAEKSKVSNYSTLTKAEAEYKRLMQAGATDVDNLISKIGTVTANSGPAISNAWNAYNALTAEQKALVKKFNTLQEATQKWNQLKADEVVKLIDKIEEPVTEKSKASIEAARKAFDGLTDAQKRLVTNTKKLTDAEKAYAQLTATPEDKEKAQKVIDLIKKLTNVTLDSEKDIQAARKAYDALTDLQKPLVDNYDVLTTAETKLAMLKAMGKVSDPYISTGDYMEKLGTPGIGSIGGEWMVIGLARSGRTVPGVEDYYKKALEYIESSIDPETGRLHKAKSTDNSRMILALTALGRDVTNVGGHNLLAGLSDLEYVKYQGNNGPIWALLALDSGNYPVPSGGTVTRQALIDEILRVQTSDGGWTVSGDKADSDMTGMALTALAPYYTKDLKVQEAIDKAIARLSEMQDEDGGYSTSYDGTTKIATSESISQVVTALSALGINADTDPRFVKNGNSVIDALLRYYVKGGGFKHVMDGEIDGMGTEQAYYALTAYYRFLSGKTNLYDMTDIIDMGGDPVELTTEPTVPATTEPAQVEQAKAGYPWWILVICIFGGCGWGVAIMLIIPKLKKKKD